MQSPFPIPDMHPSSQAHVTPYAFTVCRAFFFLSHVMNWMGHAHSKNEQAPQDQMNDNEMKQ